MTAKMMKVSRKYNSTLERYLLWRVGSFLRPQELPFDEQGPSAASVMFNWESNGIKPTTTSEPAILADYMQGKTSRDWHITEWKEGVAHGYFFPYEFFGCLGFDQSEFEKVFK